MSRRKIGIIGCGDFLRWQEAAIRASQGCVVSMVFDLDPEKAAQWAVSFEAVAARSAEEVMASGDVDVILLFVPPWIRKDLLMKAAGRHKAILTTKPLAPTFADCEAMLAACDETMCGVIYNRTENAEIEALRRVLQEGRYGRLALYKQDWIHHFPQWNDWATDPDRNGGPFMDAMIHNLNIARHLMGSDVMGGFFASNNHAQSLRCRDTEFMKVDFEGGGAAHLFITWAADLKVFGTEGNFREHIEQLFMVTDQGWLITKAAVQDRAPVGGDPNAGGWLFRRDGETVRVPPVPVPNVYDAFITHWEGRGPWPDTLVSLKEAAEDIRIIRAAMSDGRF
jgi:predicted dehydrogenase